MAAQRQFRPGDIYSLARKGVPWLDGGVGVLKAASKERIRAAILGLPVDHAKIGQPGDGLLGAQAIADHLNEIFHSAQS